MPPSIGSNRMAQYARNAPTDPGLTNGNTNLPKTGNQAGQPRSDTPQVFPLPTRQAITESAKLPAPKPFAPGRAQPTHPRQPNHSGLPLPLPQPLPQPLPIQSPPNPPDMSPPRQHRQRANSRSSDATGFWPESQIDSQFGSPTTQRSERYDAAMDGRIRSPPPTLENMPQPPIDDNMPFMIGKNGMMRIVASNQGPNQSSGVPRSMVEPAPQPDAYSSEPIYNSPTRRPTKITLHPTTVRRSYEAPAYNDDQEVFSDSPTYHVPSHNLRRVKKEDKVQEPRRSTIFQEDEEVEGSLASDYPVSEDDRGTPRPSRKKAPPREPALLENSLPSLARNQRDKTRKRRRDSCDYADEELAGMSYSQLREQPFDDDPAKKSPQSVGPLTGDSLPVKLEHFKGQRDADQKQFFMQMTVSDWERSGDWFLEQFGQVAQKLKEARQNKREMVEQFETEIASREEAVRLRTENITKKLDKIKHKGEDMLADKEI